MTENKDPQAPPPDRPKLSGRLICRLAIGIFVNVAFISTLYEDGHLPLIVILILVLLIDLAAISWVSDWQKVAFFRRRDVLDADCSITEATLRPDAYVREIRESVERRSEAQGTAAATPPGDRDK